MRGGGERERESRFKMTITLPVPVLCPKEIPIPVPVGGSLVHTILSVRKVSAGSRFLGKDVRLTPVSPKRG